MAYPCSSSRWNAPDLSRWAGRRPSHQFLPLAGGEVRVVRKEPMLKLGVEMVGHALLIGHARTRIRSGSCIPGFVWNDSVTRWRWGKPSSAPHRDPSTNAQNPWTEPAPEPSIKPDQPKEPIPLRCLVHPQEACGTLGHGPRQWSGRGHLFGLPDARRAVETHWAVQGKTLELRPAGRSEYSKWEPDM